MRFDRTGISTDEDDAIITMHCRGVQAGLPDVLNPMDDTNRGNFAGKVQAWWNAVRSLCATGCTAMDVRFYALGANASELLGPPDKIVTLTGVGQGGTAALPLQVALSTTFITDQRKTWGRFYLPCAVQSTISSARITGSAMTTLANAATGLTSRSGSGACLTVWSRKEWTHHDPQFVQVDDVPDVIRSRRLRTTITRTKVAAT